MALESLRKSFSNLSLTTRSSQLTSLDNHEPITNPLIKDTISGPTPISPDPQTGFKKIRPPPSVPASIPLLAPTLVSVTVPGTKSGPVAAIPRDSGPHKPMSQALITTEATHHHRFRALASLLKNNKKRKHPQGQQSPPSLGSMVPPPIKRAKKHVSKMIYYTKSMSQLLHRKFRFKHHDYQLVRLDQQQLEPVYQLVRLRETQEKQQPIQQEVSDNESQSDLTGALLYILGHTDVDDISPDRQSMSHPNQNKTLRAMLNVSEDCSPQNLSRETIPGTRPEPTPGATHTTAPDNLIRTTIDSIDIDTLIVKLSEY